MARACAAQTNATYLKLAGQQLRMFIGDGAKLLWDDFQLVKEKVPCIIFIDEVAAIGTKRFDRYPFGPFGLPFRAEDLTLIYKLVNYSSRSLYALLVCPSQPTKLWHCLKKTIVIRNIHQPSSTCDP